jgi:nicotinamidase/pyrazinamidase
MKDDVLTIKTPEFEADFNIKEIASFDVDPQKGFTPLCPKELPIKDGDKIVDELNKQFEYAGLRIGSGEFHPPDALWITRKKEEIQKPIEGFPDVDVKWPEHCTIGTKGAELLKGLPSIGDYNFFVHKGIQKDMHPYGACFHDLSENLSTGVIEFLTVNNIELVLVGGLALDYCVAATCFQLINAGFYVIINLDATRSVAEKSAKKAIGALNEKGAMFIKCADDLKKAIS